MAKDLPKWHKRIEKEHKYSAELLHDVETSLHRLSWVLFALNSFTLMSFAKVQPMKPPTECPKPDTDHNSTAEASLWLPYPSRTKRRGEFHPQDHFLALLSLAEKATRDERLFAQHLEKDRDDIRAGFEDLFQELRDWPKTLPECMKLHDASSPHVLALQ